MKKNKLINKYKFKKKYKNNSRIALKTRVKVIAGKDKGFIGILIRKYRDRVVIQGYKTTNVFRYESEKEIKKRKEIEASEKETLEIDELKEKEDNIDENEDRKYYAVNIYRSVHCSNIQVCPKKNNKLNKSFRLGFNRDNKNKKFLYFKNTTKDIYRFLYNKSKIKDNLDNSKKIDKKNEK